MPSKSYHENWEDLVAKEFPLATENKRSNILHLSGKFSVNPVILITKVLIDDMKNLRYLTQSDKGFNSNLASFANNVSKHGQEFYLKKKVTEKTPALEYVLRELLNTEEYINNFTWKLGYLMSKYELKEKATSEMHARQSNKDIVLDLPFPANECWQISATHYGSLGNRDEMGKLAMNSLDFSPSLFQNWGVSFNYLNSEGHVHAAHSGKMNKYSNCSVEIDDMDSDYQTYYSHIIVQENITDGCMVTRGQLIGTIDLHPDHANCNCDWVMNHYECSTGPHVHFELRKNGFPVHLNDRTISQYRIRAGNYSHDEYCSDPESCEFAHSNGSLCATMFIDTRTGHKYCPTVKGQNLGDDNILEFRLVRRNGSEI